MFCRVGIRPFVLVVFFLICFDFLAGAFLDTHRLAEEVIHFQRDPTGVVGSGTDPQVAWSFLEIITAAEARLRVLGEQIGRLSQAGTAMTATLLPGSIEPNSFTRLARWLEM